METVIYGVLQEEKSRNLKMQEMYTEEIMSLPKGTVSKPIIWVKTKKSLKKLSGILRSVSAYKKF